MPTTDGELSEPDETIVLADPDASIAPPPDGDPDRPPLLPDGIPGGPDPAPEAPTPYDPTPDEPAPFAPDESVDPDRTPGGRAF
ncbi:hypothetical protein FJ656_11725 [Schumannella luteola]|nr:hypothetical protein FJ656_11725 [Schumannella luteola]